MRRALQESNALQRWLLLEEALRLHRMAKAETPPAPLGDEGVASPTAPPQEPTA